VPIEGASIELWQPDSSGKYIWEKQGKLMSPSAAFAGTGQAMTNNLGEFQFLTIFPGVIGDRAPHLNFRITHPDFPTLYTEIFFEGDHRNKDDSQLNSLPSVLRDALQAKVTLPDPNAPETYLLASLKIVLTGNNKFKRY
jgi:protocatechuate 3,4-dioxygenase beta subunit